MKKLWLIGLLMYSPFTMNARHPDWTKAISVNTGRWNPNLLTIKFPFQEIPVKFYLLKD